MLAITGFCLCFLLVGFPSVSSAADSPLSPSEDSDADSEVSGSEDGDVGSWVFDTSSDQLKKPHRLTWFAEGRWWAVLRKSSGTGSGWRVWRRNADGTWDFGPTVLTTVGGDRFDVFRNPDDGRVFAHHLADSGSRLLRLHYDAGADMFTVAAAAAVPTTYAGGTSSLTVDTVGRVWIVTHPNGRFTYTVRDADTLAQIQAPTPLTDAVESGSLVAGRFVDQHGPAVGFIYSGPGPLYRGSFKVQRDVDPPGTFTTEQFAEQVDDHTTFAAAGSDVVAVWKDERDVIGQPIVLAKRRHPDGTWGPAVEVFTAKSSSSSGNHTRPRVAIDAASRRAHVVAAEVSSGAAEVQERVARIDTLEFGPQRTIFRSGALPGQGHSFSDVHPPQQPVTSDSGLLWLARGREVFLGTPGSFSLWESLVDVALGPVDPPVEPSVVITSSHPAVDEGSSVSLVASVEGTDAAVASVDWGDGSVDEVAVSGGVVSASHTFVADGEFEIVVAVEAPGGVRTDRMVQRVANVAPVLSADSGDVADEIGAEVTFGVEFVDPGLADAHTVTFDFGAGDVPAVVELAVGERSASASYVYEAAGAFPLAVTVTDDGGGSGSVTRTAVVSEAPVDPPTAEFGVDRPAVLVGESVNFSDLSSGSPTSWAWAFGDGAMSTERNPVHAYSEVGTFSVSLTVSNAGGTDTTVKTDYITVGLPGGNDPTPFIVTPVADAYTRSKYPTRNYGTQDALRIRNGREIYRSHLMFGVPDLSGPAAITLRLHVTTSSPDGGTLHPIANDWTETGLTWDTAPPLGLPVAHIGPTGSAGSILDVDLGTIPAAGTYSWTLASDISNSAIYASRETSAPPQLIVTPLP